VNMDERLGSIRGGELLTIWAISFWRVTLLHGVCSSCHKGNKAEVLPHLSPSVSICLSICLCACFFPSQYLLKQFTDFQENSINSKLSEVILISHFEFPVIIPFTKKAACFMKSEIDISVLNFTNKSCVRGKYLRVELFLPIPLMYHCYDSNSQRLTNICGQQNTGGTKIISPLQLISLYCLDLRFSRWRVWKWLSSGMLHRVSL
jgi:hypothetical protein